VRKAGLRLRITAQLIEAETGAHLWADKFDGAVADVFDLQDQIAQSVTAAIEPRLFAAEQTRFQSKRPENLDAWGFVMKAMPHVWSWRSAREIETAMALLTRALEIEPDYPRASGLLAWARATGAHQGWADVQDALTEARSMAQRAIQADPYDPWSHFAAGYVHMISRDFSQAVAELNEAIALNPSFAFAHLILGVTYGFGGMPEDGLRHIEIATRLSPRDFTKWQTFPLLASATLLRVVLTWPPTANVAPWNCNPISSAPGVHTLPPRAWPNARTRQLGRCRKPRSFSRPCPSNGWRSTIRSSMRVPAGFICKGCAPPGLNSARACSVVRELPPPGR
jgi:tetratricopeptide (TPR) repeat protein